MIVMNLFCLFMLFESTETDILAKISALAFL